MHSPKCCMLILASQLDLHSQMNTSIVLQSSLYHEVETCMELKPASCPKSCPKSCRNYGLQRPPDTLQKPVDRLPSYDQHGHVVAPGLSHSYFWVLFRTLKIICSGSRKSQRASSTARSHWFSAEWCNCCALTLCRRPADLVKLAVREQVHSKSPVQPLHRLGTSLQLCH